MALLNRGVLISVASARPTGLGACSCLFLALLPFGPAVGPRAHQGEVISRGERIHLRSQLGVDGPTLFAFYAAASVMERDATARLASFKRLRGRIRRIPLDSLDAPVARQFRIQETPTFLVCDPAGRVLLRGSQTGPVKRLLERLGCVNDRRVVRRMPPACPLSTGPRLAWVEESSPKAGRVYRQWSGGQLAVPDIYKAMSLRPDLMERVADLTDRAHFTSGFLSRRTKELIATYVSSLNRCPYCLGSHADNLRALGASARQTEAIARHDLTAASLSRKERTLLTFVKILTVAPATVSDAQIAQLRHAGWHDGAIFEAAFETALFAFFNRIAQTYGLASPTDLWRSAGADDPKTRAGARG
jgi:uncharacterized peroxidase-related enzyme